MPTVPPPPFQPPPPPVRASTLDAFSFDVPPFDRLTATERNRLLDGVDLVFHHKESVILRRHVPADCLHVVIKGNVQERRGKEILAAFGPGDCFGLRSLFEAAPTNIFVAHEDTLCHVVPKALLVELMRVNSAFGDFFFQDICEKIRLVSQSQSAREMASLTMTRIRHAYMHPPLFIDAAASAREAVALMKARNANALLVRDLSQGTERIGVLTGTDLREAVILGDQLPTAPVGPMAQYNLLTLAPNDLVVNALTLMARHSVRRLVISDSDGVAGLLEQVDLLSFISNHSQIIAVQVDRAETPDELVRAGGDVVGLIRALHSTGVKVRFIGELVTELNRKVFRKLFELLAPPDLIDNACLIVMGSEGRGEQILRTDQDNGLILRDGYQCPELPEVVRRFTETLISMGWPPCPGNIMVSNPEWTKSAHDFCDTIHRWIHHPDETSQLNLAIFYDAAPVAGDPALLRRVRGYLMERMADNQGFFAHFAKPTLSFETPGGRFTTLFSDRGARQPIDIKKAGVFPLVHGVRSLALEQRLTLTATEERIWELESLGVLDHAMATEMVDALDFLHVQRLEAHIDTAENGTQPDNFVYPDRLSKLDRDQLKDCLQTVKKFKEFITYHFHLNLF